MRPLSSSDIIGLWERGEALHPLDRALGLLRAALPESSYENLASLGIGRRDALLLELRERTFGKKLRAYCECPHCRNALEMSLNVADMRTADSRAETDEFKISATDKFEMSTTEEFEMKTMGTDIRFRLPNSLDLAATLDCEDRDAAYRELLGRCILEARSNGHPVSLEELPDDALQEIADGMGECDPQAEVLLNLNCPDCRAPFQTPFDIVHFFWIELSVHAKRLLEEIHLLARHYGWSESSILTMSARRRQHYLDLIGT